MRELGWEALMHPPYSSDLAPSDYHLFRPLKNSLNGVKLASKEARENHLVQFFAQEISEVLQWQNYDFTRKVAKGHRSKRHIYHWLVFEISMNKFALKNIKKTEITFSPDQYFILKVTAYRVECFGDHV